MEKTKRVGKCTHCGKVAELSEEIKPDHCVPCQKKRFEPNWKRKCENCGASPVLPLTGMCGPCTFGEAETIGGNW